MGNCTSYSSESDHADRQLAQRSHRRQWYRKSPLTMLDVQMIGDDPTGQRQEESQCMVGYFVDAVVGNVADWDGVSSGGSQIDVVDANAIADKDSRLWHRRHHRLRDFCKLDDDGVRFP
jgi:hypothetical protein